ncbi:MAG TPA: glycosyl transferase family 1 [Planctomycetaceae bacterium]|nr:glycosyl transferase family 1 [Planctomycetaceae bacterium]
MNTPQGQRWTIVMPSAEPTGGAEEALLQFVRSPASESIALQICFLEQGSLEQETERLGIPTRRIKTGRTREIGKWWRAAGEIAGAAVEFGGGGILGWMTKGHVYGGLAAWRAGLSAAWFQMGLPESGLLDRAARKLPAKAVFACSEYVAKLQRQAQPRVPVVAIPLGVDLTRFRSARSITPAEARRRLGLPDTGPIIGIVGRLQAWKGMHVLIDAMPEVLRHHPTAHCVAVGGPFAAEPEYPRILSAQVQRMGLQSSVSLTGMQKDIPLWMQAMDVVVHASDREPFGIVIVEALALGKQVIATAPGGPAEIIRDGQNGHLVSFGNHQELASKLQLILSQTDQLPQSELIRTAEHFSDAAYAQRLVDALVNILKMDK